MDSDGLKFIAALLCCQEKQSHRKRNKKQEACSSSHITRYILGLEYTHYR